MKKSTPFNPLKRAFFICLLMSACLISVYALQGPPTAAGRHGGKPHRHLTNPKDSLAPRDTAKWGDVTIELAHDSDSICLDSDFVCNGDLHLKRGKLKLGHHKLKIHGGCVVDSGTIECDSTSSIEIEGNDSIVKLHFCHGKGRHLGKLKIHHCDTTVIEGDVVVTDSVEVMGGILDISNANFDVQGVLSMVNSMMAGDRRTTFTWKGTNNRPDTLRFARGKDTLGTLKIDRSAFPLVISSNLRVADSLCLNNNKLHIRSGILSLDSSCVLKGFNRSSYIITGDSGAVKRRAHGLNKEIEFPIGTVNNYAPACITPTKGHDSTAYCVSAAYGVLAKGLTGDSISGPMVKTTWHVTCTADSFKMTLKLKWPKNLETPGFNRVKCFISHYEHNRWDSVAPAVATTDTALVSLTRTGIESLSPFTVMSAKVATAMADMQESKVTVYPNPATDRISFTSVAAGSKLSIYDLTGSVKQSVILGGEGSTVSVSDMPAGLYLYKVVSNGKVAATGKLAIKK